MIEIIVLVILIVFVLYSLIALSKSILLFIVNIALLWVVFTRFFVDWKKKELRNYYIVSVFIVLLIYLTKDFFFIGWIFKFMTKALVLETVQILVLVFLFANLLFLAHKSIKRAQK